MLAKPELLDYMKLNESEDDTDFTLSEHTKERIDFHLKMLLHYWNERKT